MTSTASSSITTLDQAHELRARIGHAHDATSDSIDLLLAECQALPAMTRRTLQRVLGEARRHLADAHRMADTQAVLGARLLDTTSTTELHTTEAQR